MRSILYASTLSLMALLLATPVQAEQANGPSTLALVNPAQPMMSFPADRVAAATCSGRFCCCDLKSRGVICAPKAKCKGGGARCVSTQSCPK